MSSTVDEPVIVGEADFRYKVAADWPARGCLSCTIPKTIPFRLLRSNGASAVCTGEGPSTSC